MLLDGDGGELSVKQIDLLTKGYERNNEVIEIVNNLLDVSEIEDGRFMYKFTEYTLTDIVNQVVHDTQVNADRKEITVNVTMADKIPPMKLDRQKMKMALRNLVDNAIKYSHRHSTIDISVAKVKNNIEIAVQDYGIGMSDETKEKMFTKFFRGKEATIVEPTGSGLGLYIIRSIVKKHGGDVRCDSKLNEGTRFTITLPTINF